MSETGRKKSTSSDSELSDGWSLVEHSDAAPSPQLNYSDISLHSSESRGSWNSESTAQVRSTGETETSSDAESVDIIQEDSLLSDFGLHRAVSNITKVNTSGEKNNRVELIGKTSSAVVVQEPDQWGIASSSLHSYEWCRLLIFTSSLVALLLLLVSYGSLFFKEQTYAKSDGVVVLPDEDLSSLISDLAIIKEENSRLKEELNMIKYEYGNNLKAETENEEVTIESPSVDQVIGLEIISDEGPLDSVRISSKYPADLLTQDSSSDPRSTGRPFGDSSQTDRLRDLIQLEEQLKSFIENIGLSNVIVSSYNIAHNLDNINIIVKHLNDVIDKQTESKRDSKKFQLQQKLTKLMNKIEHDFKKSLEKVAKRVNKFHSESLGAFCRIKGGVSDVENIDCSGFEKHREEAKSRRENSGEQRRKQRDEKITDSKSSESVKQEGRSGPGTGPQSNENSGDPTNRYKRSGESEGNREPSIHLKKTSTNPDSQSKQKYKKSDRYPDKILNSDKDTFNNIASDNNANIYASYRHDNNAGRNVHNNNNHGKKIKFGPNSSMRGKKVKRKNKQDGNKESRVEEVDESGVDRKNINKQPVGDSKNRVTIQNNERQNSASSEEYSEKFNRDKINTGSAKCVKKNCIKRQGKHAQNTKPDSESKPFNQFENSKNPSGPPNIHNESIYARMSNGRRKTLVNGEWYLDLGETRRQKRASRASRGEWMFDRALVRDWCRTNSKSSLCASFGQNLTTAYRGSRYSYS